MFQYAFALAVRKKTGERVVLDRNWFPEFGGTLRNAVPREFGLGVYRLSIDEYVGREVSNRVVYGDGVLGKVREFLHYRPGLLREGRCDLRLDSLGKYAGRDYVMRGFFQKVAYPEYVRDELLTEFRVNEDMLNAQNRELLAQIAACGDAAVFAHVRRGDYTLESTRRIFGLCSLDYYARAEKMIAERIGVTPHLFVFSDDMEWVRANYRSDFPLTYVDINSGNKPYLDINLMRSCRHGITANSTFSWWGAWLIENPNAVVVSPEQWYASSCSADGLRPERWLLA